MAKKESASRKYLRILGIVSMVLSCIIIILGIVFLANAKDISLADLGGDELIKALGPNVTEETAKTALGVMAIVSGAVQILMAALLIRAANDPHKSTFLFVLLVLETIAGIYFIATSGFGNAGSAVTNIISLAIDVLALFCVYNARREVNA